MLAPVFWQREISPSLKQIQENVTTKEPSRNQDCPGVSLLETASRVRWEKPTGRQRKQKHNCYEVADPSQQMSSTGSEWTPTFCMHFIFYCPTYAYLASIVIHHPTALETEAHRASEIYPKLHLHKWDGQEKPPTCLPPKFFHLSTMQGYSCFMCLFIL